jgi:hypothetical protein
MTMSIQLDLAFENDINELYDLFANTDIEFKVLIEEGPGGGWPVCELTSDESTLRNWLLENYCDPEEVNFYMGLED